MPIEISELKQDVVLSTANKIYMNMELSETEKETSEAIDAWAKEIGERGCDPNHEIAAFIQKTVTPAIYDAPDELLDRLFDRGNIGEFDDYIAEIEPKNTLVVYDAAKGGNVYKSYIDYTELAPTWCNKQVETAIRYADLRKNGAKTVAKLVVFMEEALKRKMMKTVFDAISAAITSGMADQYITSATTVTETAMDALALYLADLGGEKFTVSQSKYAQAISKLTNASEFLIEKEKNALHDYGFVSMYQGVEIGHVSSKVKAGTDAIVPAGVVLGFGGKIGRLDMRGEVRTYEDMDNNKEQVNIKMTGFEFGYCITAPENIAKIVIS